MSRAKTNKLYRTFNKGLITEAGYLTYPEDASIDELNTIISRKGNRTRRLGIDYEDDFVFNAVGVTDDTAINEFVWLSAAKQATANFLVIQVGGTIHFWKMDSVPLSDNKRAYTINLLRRGLKPPTSAELDVTSTVAQFDAGSGYLFIAHPFVEPICVEYDPITDTLKETRVIIQIRDLLGVHDGLANDEEPRTLSKEHKYNLQNQGWVAPGTQPARVRTPGETRVLIGQNDGTADPEDTDEISDDGESGVFYDPYTGEDVPYWKSPDDPLFERE